MTIISIQCHGIPHLVGAMEIPADPMACMVTPSPLPTIPYSVRCVISVNSVTQGGSALDVPLD
ncbi:hypothetical protein N7533_011147 [Penicillium manginii]|uniref:uncharacterized protein n=1 Tax=Penicillium manginii TaxID=203109 RepID=UPI002547AFFF|nr:uncharacterized protein N7533_011147 [Penicillium manginii]KAJ5741738.1 hypothetical protein N7533_011147 [Penicillium manginii]